MTDTRVTTSTNFAIYKGDAETRVTTSTNFAIYKGEKITRVTASTCFAIVKFEVLPTTGKTWSLVKIDLSALTYDYVDKSYLYFYNDNATPFEGTLSLHDRIVDWNANFASWNNSGSGVPWDTPGGTPGVDYVATPFVSVNIEASENSWWRVEITSWMNSKIAAHTVEGFWMIVTSPGWYLADGIGSGTPLLQPYVLNVPNVAV